MSEREKIRKPNPRPALAGLAVALAILPLVAQMALAEPVQKQGVRVAVRGRLKPLRLPRSRTEPVTVALAGHISPTEPGGLPQLRRIAIAINSHGRLNYRGLPLCRISQIQPATSDDAMRACGRTLVGTGKFSSNVKLPEQSPFPSRGQVLAFNGRYHGRPAILAHIFGTHPAPISFVLPFTIRHAHGTYGTILEARLPQATGTWGFVTGVSLILGRGHGPAGSEYVSASCPAPAGFALTPFQLARTTFEFAEGPRLKTTVTRTCRVR